MVDFGEGVGGGVTERVRWWLVKPRSKSVESARETAWAWSGEGWRCGVVESVSDEVEIGCGC